MTTTTTTTTTTTNVRAINTPYYSAETHQEEREREREERGERSDKEPTATIDETTPANGATGAAALLLKDLRHPPGCCSSFSRAPS